MTVRDDQGNILLNAKGLFGLGSNRTRVTGEPMILDADTPLSKYGIDDQLGCNFQLNWTNYAYWSSVFEGKIGNSKKK